MHQTADAKHTTIPESLSQRLRQLAHAHTEIAGAQLQILNLGEIAASYGDRWLTVRARVFHTALQFLKKRLAEFDTLIPCSDGFIVIFGEDEGQAAELTGLKLADALNKFFLGEGAFGQCEVACKHLSLNPADIESFIQSLGEASHASAVRGTDPAPSSQVLDYQIRYRPVCDTRKKFIVTYFSEPVDASGKPFHPDEQLSQTAARRSYLALDRAAIEAGIAATRKLIAAGGRIIVGLTVHCESLAEQTRRHAVLDALGRIDAELRRYTIVRLTHVPPGFPRSYLEEHIRMLTQKQMRLGFDLSVDDPNTDILSHPAISLFGYHLSPAIAALFRDPNHPTVTLLRNRARRIREAGKRLAVIADGSTNMEAICKELDADYASALNLWPLEAEPKNVHSA